MRESTVAELITGFTVSDRGEKNRISHLSKLRIFYVIGNPWACPVTCKQGSHVTVSYLWLEVVHMQTQEG